jgi:outer membrane lipoprotein-sorting protein
MMPESVKSRFRAASFALFLVSIPLCDFHSAFASAAAVVVPPATATPAATSATTPTAKASSAGLTAGPSAGPSAGPEAKLALQKAIAFQRDAKDLTLKFRAVVYTSALEKEDIYDGKLLLKDSTRFRLEIPGGVFVSDGVTYWEYHSQNHQVVIRKAKDLEDKPLPGDVLLRFLDSEPMSLVKAKADGKEFLEMRLDPTRAMKNLDSLAVLLDKGNYSVHRISSRDVSGNEAKYTVTSIKRNAGLKDKEFSFTPPKGTDLVDMRE